MTEHSGNSKSRNEIYNYASSMLPLMDVIFILLFFLMAVAIQKAVVNQLRVDLPKVTDSYGAQKEPQVSIEMALGGQVHFSGNVYLSLDSFLDSSPNIPMSVLLKADRHIEYGNIMTLIDFLKKNGTTNIALASEHSRK